MKIFTLLTCLTYAVLLTLIASVGGANQKGRILALFPFFGRSHFNMFGKIVKTLADRGYEVDVVGHFPLKEKYKGYNDISLEGSVPIFHNNLTMKDISRTSTKYLGMDFIFREAGSDLCRRLFQLHQLKQLRDSKAHYDLVLIHLFGLDCFLGFAHKFQAPTVGLLTSVPMPHMNDRFGNPDNPSYIPTYFSPYPAAMTFYQRVVNTIFVGLYKLGYKILAIDPSNVYMKEFFGRDTPDLEVLVANMSLALTNSHFSINQARPMSPAVVEVGGIHIDEPTGILPLAFQKIIDSSPNGIIIFSLGSMVRTDTFDANKLKALYDAFAALPYTVIWKGDAALFPANKPANVIFSKWLPQFELMCHNSTKLFISHGGLFGTQEALYCGLPFLGMPLFADQHVNIGNYEDKGIALKLAYERLTKEYILDRVWTILNSTRYAKRTRELSQRFKDRPQPAIDTAVYWIEYVLRNGGAPYLKPYSVNLCWFQQHLIDVFAFLLAVVFVVGFIFWKVLRCCYRIGTRGKVSGRGKKEKRQ